MPGPRGDRRLQVDAVKLPIAQKHDCRSRGNQRTDRFQQRDVRFLGKMPLLALHHDPGHRQRPMSVQYAHDQSQAAAPHFATIHHQHQVVAALRQLLQHGLGERQEAPLGVDVFVLHPAAELLGEALVLHRAGHLAGHFRQLAALAQHDARDHGRQRIQVAAAVAFRVGKRSDGIALWRRQ